MNIRKLQRSELSIPLLWAAQEGWNPGRNDGEAFYAADPNGFFVGEVDGEPVAVISAVKYGQEFGFIGCYIVKNRWRGHGYGKQIFVHALKYLGGLNAGLDAVLAQESNYQRSGFHTAYRNIRYELKGGGVPASGVEFLDESSLEKIARFDRQCFPAIRKGFLQAWISLPGHRCVGIVDENELTGFAVLRPCETCLKIGPLFADNGSVAKRLLETLLSTVSGQPVFLDTPGPNRAAVELAEEFGGRQVFQTLRMYNRFAPAISLHKIFGVTTFELG